MKLSDFVLPKQYNARDFDDGSMYGALLYQAPEVFKDELLNKSPPSLSSSGWSDDLVDFVKKCLVKDVNERASVEALLKVSVVVMDED